MRLFNQHKNASDEDLMQRFQGGSESAFEELYRRYSKRLLHFLYRILDHNEPLAQDVLHDVFTGIVERPDRFDVQRLFKPWIFTVTANAARKQFRGPLMEDMETVEATWTNAEPPADHQLDHQIFRTALRKELCNLSYNHRCTYILRIQEQLSIREVSEIMDCSEGTVKSRIHYTIRFLAQRLEAHNPIQSR